MDWSPVWRLGRREVQGGGRRWKLCAVQGTEGTIGHPGGGERETIRAIDSDLGSQWRRGVVKAMGVDTKAQRVSGDKGPPDIRTHTHFEAKQKHQDRGSRQVCQ